MNLFYALWDQVSAGAGAKGAQDRRFGALDRENSCILPPAPEADVAEGESMKRWMLIALLFTTPAFAASMNIYASQQGGTNLIQMIPGELPLLTTTYAGTALQNTFPTALIFQTNIAPVGTFTLAMSLNIGGQQFTLPTATYSCTTSPSCFFDSTFVLPTFFHATQGTLTVNVNGSVSTYGFVFQSPVPEPGTLLLVGTGILAMSSRKQRNKAKFTKRT
jgi:hypothetical protein